MNTRETVIITSPNGTEEECAKFVIDDISESFVFHGITEVDEKYVFSAWVKSDTESSLTIENQQMSVTTEWARRKVGITATSKSLSIKFNTVGTYYLYKSQLEIGDVMTDWAPSPEDIKASLEIKINRENLVSEINATADIIRLRGGHFVVESDNLTIAEDGTLTATNGVFNGTINASAGTIGGWEIGDNGLIFGDEGDTTYTTISGFGVSWILGLSENFWNPVAEKIEYLPYSNRCFQFYKGDKQYDEENVQTTPVGGFDSIGIFVEDKYCPDPVFNPEEGDYILTWHGVANLKRATIAHGLKVGEYINSGGRIYLPNNRAIKGLNADYTFDEDTALDNSQTIGYVNSSNRTILGHSSNSNPTEMRSPSSLYLKCNGSTEDDNNQYGIRFFKDNNGTAWFRPCASGATNLGGSNYPWNNIYATNDTIQTSDRRKKTDIKELDGRYLELFDNLTPKSFKMLDGKRTHIGFIAQEVEEAMKSVGLSNEDFAGLCIDCDENNEQHYSLRYGELFMLCVAKIKELERKLNNEY